MKNVKNIIFDLGGVLLQVDYDKSEKAFLNYGIADYPDLFSQNHASHLFESLETGKITPKEFFVAFRAITASSLTDLEIKNAWNAMLGDFYLDRLEWLKELSNRYQVYLFSNTNQIHSESFHQTFLKQTGTGNFDDYFIKTYYSYQVGFRKPHPSSYLKLLELQALNAEETVFIDDTEKNIEGAKQAGLHTLHLLPNQPVAGLF